jgi:DNA recombination protein Rad52
MTCTFSTEQIASLSAPLDRAKVRQRRQGCNQVSYLEGWQVIAEANRIFGFDGWQRETVALRCVHQAERLIGEEQRPGWGVTYTARVRISVSANTAGQPALIREGCGAGHGIDTDLGQAHESALKEAETDAMKRALMTFGNAFGLALYDKQQREVTSAAASGGDRSRTTSAERPRQTPLRVVPPAPAPTRSQGMEHQVMAAATSKTEPPSAQPVAAAQPPALDPGMAPLDPATIRQLHATIRGLPAPVLEGFSKAFRKRFQVPAEAPSIADRICQRRHHDWIETFLVQHQSQPETAALQHG